MKRFFAGDIHRKSNRGSSILRFKGLDIECERHNIGGFYSVCFGGSYDPILRSLREDDVVLDGGANVGVFSLVAASRCRKVFSVEPNEENFRTLLRNIERNGASNIIPVNAAIAPKSGPVGFQGLGEVGHLSSHGKVVQGTTIDLVTNGEATILKLDIEGAEPLAIRGMRSLDGIRMLAYERDQRALDRLTADPGYDRFNALSYELLDETLRHDGFELANSRQAIGNLLSKLLLPDLWAAEVRTGMFGTRAGLDVLLDLHKVLLLPSGDESLDMIYAVRN